jgi:predicted RNase H-like nuclease (RuvC/YqgF family)
LLLSYIEPHLEAEDQETLLQRISQLNLELKAQKDTVQRLQKQEDSLRKSLELERRTRSEVQSKYDRLRGADEAISGLNMEELLLLEGEVVSVLTKLSERKQQLLRRTTSELLCVVCLDEPKRIMLSPCNHLCLCRNCANSGILNECPVCRARVSKRVEVFM